jgi:hypothetical protein
MRRQSGNKAPRRQGMNQKHSDLDERGPASSLLDTWYLLTPYSLQSSLPSWDYVRSTE